MTFLNNIYAQLYNPIKVLPYLQLLSKENEIPERWLEVVKQTLKYNEEKKKYNVWFQDDIEVIDELFHAENSSTISELWLGMIDYYVNEFDYENHVIQVFIFYSFY